MQNTKHVRGALRLILAVPMLASLLAIGVVPAAAVTLGVPNGSTGANAFTTSGALGDVAATSASNAWAVGTVNNFRKTLILHWNGRRWRQVPSPTPAGSFINLERVAAVSSHLAWAVGGVSGKSGEPLLLRWSGSTWTQVKRLPAALNGSLSDVAARSAKDAWAVGTFEGKGGYVQALLLHWNGRAWKQVLAKQPARSYSLPVGVAVSASGSAWAVGGTSPKFGDGGYLIMRWNGRSWQQVPSPVPAGPKGSGGLLSSVAIVSPGDAWAVGSDPYAPSPAILHWNGRSWKRVPGPRTGYFTVLSDVVMTSARSGWAVGSAGSGSGSGKTLILRWNGTRWRQVPSPTPAGGGSLAGLAIVSATNAWAVGQDANGKGSFILHWNGRVWRYA